MVTAADTNTDIWAILETVSDPEVPVLSILDLGIVRDVLVIDATTVTITITPTYTGCPAMHMIGAHIRLALTQSGYKNITIREVLSPAWTTDWMSEAGKQKLLAYGIAPPQGSASRVNKLLFGDDLVIACPQCGATDTRLVSEFGSTACKAFYQCNVCKEPFDYFKCH